MWRVPEDGALLLSVPYDRGWSLTVDGAAAQLEPAFGGGMSAVQLSAGEHRIEMSFRSPGLILGCAVTAVAAGGLVEGLALARRRRP